MCGVLTHPGRAGGPPSRVARSSSLLGTPEGLGPIRLVHGVLAGPAGGRSLGTGLLRPRCPPALGGARVLERAPPAPPAPRPRGLRCCLPRSSCALGSPSWPRFQRTTSARWGRGQQVLMDGNLVFRFSSVSARLVQDGNEFVFLREPGLITK